MKFIFLTLLLLLIAPVEAALNEVQFNSIIDRVTGHYKNQFSKKYPLTVLRNWNDPEPNALAESMVGRNPTLTFYGGLVRYKELTSDGFAMVVCHELGHLIGGAPLMRSKPNKYFRLISAEGQADYFAPFCFREVFKNDSVVEVNAPAVVQKECRLHWKKESDASLCMRIAVAGFNFVKVSNDYELMNYNKVLDFEKPDPTVANQVFGRQHPYAQCRLDTFFQAALCVPRTDEKISFNVESNFYCDTRRGDTVGTRPLCWFKSNN